jgi:serine/threonine-protein kinase
VVSVSPKELKCSKYRILGLVGQGQFGRVYCASHRKTGHLVALKELDKERFPTHKFLRELRFLLSLQHTNIVNCHALEHTPTGRYLVMDYCEGGTLRSLMEDEVYLHPAEGIKLIGQVLAGLSHAHDRGIIHCDIKPENILLTLQANSWTAHISDFGIARLLRENSKDGTGNTGSPAYMAPERFYGQYSHSSDIYAVGILLFEILAGYRPFSGLPAELMSAHLNQPVKLPDIIPVELQGVILQALQKLPARRFRSAAEMAEALQAAADRVDWAARVEWHATLGPRFDMPLQEIEALYQEALQAEIGCLTVASLAISSNRSGESFSSKEANNLPSLNGNQTGVVYRVLGSRVESHSDLSWLGQKNCLDSGAVVPPGAVRLPEPIQQLVLRPQGCFAITQRAVYLLSLDLFQPGVAQHGQRRLQHGGGDYGTVSHKVPQLVAQFKGDFTAAIASNGRWMVVAALQPDKITSDLRILQLTAMPSVRKLPQAIPYLLNAVVVNSGHFVTFSHTVEPQTSACITGVSVTGYTRRGHCMGSLNLPIPLQRVLPAYHPYQMIALEPGQTSTLILLELKPLRISRIGIGMVPAMLVSTSWGYVAIASDGEILLLDRYGLRLARMQGPPNPTAVALPNPQTLLIATWKNGQGTLTTFPLPPSSLYPSL